MPPIIHHRLKVEPETLSRVLSQCERTEDRVWLSKTEVGRNYTLRGVPARLCTVYLTDCWPPSDNRDILVVEIGRKAGRYDGAERWVIALRVWLGKQLTWSDATGVLQPIQNGIFTVAPTEGAMVLAATWNGGAWAQAFPRLRSNLEDYDLSAIVMWHYNRYYKFLGYDDVKALADAFAASHPELATLTLAEANRLASRDLYRLARDLGWRKLTLREQQRLCMDSMWVRAEDATKRAAYMSTGAGQYTHEAASGEVPMYPPDEFIRTGYGIINPEDV